MGGAGGAGVIHAAVAGIEGPVALVAAEGPAVTGDLRPARAAPDILPEQIGRAHV